MAALSKHGSEVGRIERVASVKAYMSDGTVLKNAGFGWKLYGKVKPGIAPQQAYETAKAGYAAFLAARPMFAAYRDAMLDAAGIGKRWKLATAIRMMPDDPDGVWSDCCDSYSDNVECDLSDIVNLCRLYQSAEREAAALKAATTESEGA